VGDHFHHDFQAGLQAHPKKYVGLNLGCRHGLNNRHEGAKQQVYYFPMIEEQGNNWPNAKGR
jgi:hypothetical protein